MSTHRAATIRDNLPGISSDYSASKSSRFRRKRTGISLAGSGADYHYRNESDYLRLLEYARDMDRNDALVGQLVDRVVDNTIQDGFRLEPATGSAAVDARLWRLWHDWADDPEQCDTQGEFTFRELERFAFRQHLVDGDVFALTTEQESLQLLESHRCRTPNRSKRQNLINGVQLDENRRRMRYYFTRDDIDPTRIVTFGEMEPYDARDGDGYRQVLHVFNPKRCTQTRGVTAFAPIFDHCGMIEDIEFARMVQQQIVSCFGFIEEQVTGTESLPSVDTQLGARTSETQSDGSVATVEGLSPGTIVRPGVGKKYTAFSPHVPPAEFFDHMKHVLSIIGINLGAPLVLVLLDASETNFSGWRGAIDQARLGFRRNQGNQCKRFNRPVYIWKVRQWLVSDLELIRLVNAAKSDPAFNVFGHQWGKPSWPYIEPMTDTQANALRMVTCQTSPRRMVNETGAEWETIVDEKTADVGYAIRKAKDEAAAINAKYPDEPVSWRDVFSLPLPQGLTLSLMGSPQQEKQSKPPTKDASQE